MMLSWRDWTGLDWTGLECARPELDTIPTESGEQGERDGTLGGRTHSFGERYLEPKKFERTSPTTPT